MFIEWKLKSEYVLVYVYYKLYYHLGLYFIGTFVKSIINVVLIPISYVWMIYYKPIIIFYYFTFYSIIDILFLQYG